MDMNEKKPAEEIVTEQTEGQEIKAEKSPKLPMEKKDLITGAVLILFSLYLLGTGIHMSLTTMELSDSPWYGTPGMFSIFIGAALLIFSTIMIGSLLKSGVKLGKETAYAAGRYFCSRAFRRALAAIGFLAIYIFVLFGNINYLLATFIYLFATMVYFREKGFAVWKLAIISAVFTAFLYLFFGVLAGIPLS